MNFEWGLFGLRVITALILYAFLGIALSIVWQQLKTTATQRIRQTTARPRLQVVDSSNTQQFRAGDIIPLDSVTVIGSLSNNNVVLPSLPPREARLLCENQTWWLEPLHHQTKITLNQTPVTIPTQLHNEDVIQLGGVDFRFEI